jgi:hypothetical protein
MSGTAMRVWLLGPALLIAAGCHRAHPGSVASTGRCEPVETPLPATADASLLAGVFEITFVPRAGPRADSAPARARLVLHEQEASLVVLDSAAGLTQPFVGTLELDRALIGATDMGDLLATDPRRPGVAAYAQRRDGDLTALVVRLGSISNERGQQPYDAGHFTLFVRRIGSDGFDGGWASSSGAGMNPTDASGHFCAVRVG